MLNAMSLKDRLIPINEFSHGKAGKIFDSLKKYTSLIILRNNRPAGVIVSADEYDRLMELEEDNILLSEALERIQKNLGQPRRSHEDVLSALGVTREDIDNAEDVIIGWVNGT